MGCAAKLLAGTRLHRTLIRWQIPDYVTTNVLATKPQGATVQLKATSKNAEAFANVLKLVTAVPCGQEVSGEGECESQVGQEMGAKH